MKKIIGLCLFFCISVNAGTFTSTSNITPATALANRVAESTGTSFVNPATSDLQATGNTYLANLVAAITNPLPVSGTFWQAVQPVSQSGAWSVTATGSGNFTVVQPTGTNLHTVIDSGTVTLSGTSPVSGTVTANQGGTWTVQPGNTANTTAWKVDGSAVTQPVSGTVAATQSGVWSLSANQSVNVAQMNGVATTMGNGIAGTGVQRVAIASDNTAFTVNAAQSGTWTNTVTQATGTNLHTVVDSGSITLSGTSPVSGTVTANQGGTWTVQPGNTANTTAWKVDGSAVTQPVSGTVAATQSGAWSLSANQSVNVAQMNGVATTMGNGIAGTGVQRVAIASDNTAFPVNATLQTGANVIGSLSANQSVNVAQINGVTPSMGSGTNGTGVQRTTLATDQAALTTAGLFSVKIDQTTPGTTNAITDTKLPTAAASADALSNPTITQIGADHMLYNGSTWDRARGMSVATTTGDSGAKTATGNGATQTNVGNKGIQIFIVLGTVSGTTPTCVFKLQGSVDGGTNFFDIPGATTASLTASTNVGIMVYPGVTVLAGTTTTGTTATAAEVLPRTWRVVWTIGGTTPSFTITSITYNYIPN